MARFKPNDRVRIVATVSSPFVGVTGTVVEVQPQPRGITELDRYVVVFEWGEKHQFWGAELEPVIQKDC